MPYIKPEDRRRFWPTLVVLEDEVMNHGLSNGDLNFLMTAIANFYMTKHGISYNTLSDVIKAFECAKLEFYRRKVAPYEDQKILANGDV